MNQKSRFSQTIRLLVISAFAVFGLIAGLSLTFVKSNETKAQIHDDISTSALIRSQNETHSLEARAQARDVAYTAMLRAVSLSPFDAILWVHLAHVLSLKPEGTAHKPEEAMQIAARLSPALKDKLDLGRFKKQEPAPDER